MAKFFNRQDLHFLLFIKKDSPMAVKQKYGIKYPFTLDNDEEVYIDTNATYEEMLRSAMFHVIFTPKGQRLRNPNFGTDLVRFIFEPSDTDTFEKIKTEIRTQVSTFVPNIRFNDMQVYEDENDSHSRIVSINYTITKGGTEITNDVAIKI